MKRNVRVISFVMILSMFLSLSLSYASTNEENHKTKSQSYSIEKELNSAISSIKNDKIKEKLSDLYKIQYIEIAIVDGGGIETSKDNMMDGEQILSTIKSYSEMSEKELDDIIVNTINNAIDIIEARTDVALLPSSYEVLEKYNFTKKLGEIKDSQQVATSSAKANTNTRAANASYKKTCHGYIRTVIGDSLMAQYSMTVQWWTNASNQIEPYWNKTTAVSVNKTWYTYVTDKIVSEIMPSEYLRQRANIVAKCKLQNLDFLGQITSPYHYLNIDVWFYNDGRIDCRYWKTTK